MGGEKHVDTALLSGKQSHLLPKGEVAEECSRGMRLLGNP